MKDKLVLVALFGVTLIAPYAASAAPAEMAPAADQAVLRFTIERYVVESVKLLRQTEIEAAVAPYVGANKDFSDVQHALEAIENLYAKRGYSAVSVLLPEQELDKGTVHFRVVETHYGKVTVKDNQFVSEANVLNAIPSVRSGSAPRTRQVARELKLANENPARQMNVVMKAGEADDVLDANVFVTDSKPSSWGVSLDNTGSPETGRARLGLFYRYANLFDRDHVANLQYVTSPQYPDRVKVLGGSYKIPFYRLASSLEVFGGYSNVNAIVGGLSNFQGGGKLLSTRYNLMLDRVGVFEPRMSFGLDWRDFRRIEEISSNTVLYNEIVVLPVSISYTAQGKYAKTDLGFNGSLSANLPNLSKGQPADFAAYDPTATLMPDAHYRVVRYGGNYSRLIGTDWQFRSTLNGQWSSNVLILGEQLRLGGADGVRGFSEGSEGGDKGARLNLEGYTPDFGKGDFKMRALAFYDAGQVTKNNDPAKVTIAGAGIGLRAYYRERLSVRADLARIMKAGTDPLQLAGDTRAHLSLNATF